jgi:hypothetical protein
MATALSASNQQVLTGLFKNSDSAERAYQTCVDRGYEIGQVNVVISEGMRKRLLSSHNDIKAELARRKAEGGELGGPMGGRVGILVAILAAVGAAIAVPALGFGAGPIAIALAAAGAACVAAGVIALLGNWGIPEKWIRPYATAIRKGGILIMVEARSDDDARSIELDWEKSGGSDIHYR